MKVAVFGLGYVGCVSAACLAGAGHDVVGVDIVESKVEQFALGESPIVEPGLSALIADGVAMGRLTATTDQVAAIRDSELLLICIGTPTGPDGEVNLDYIVNVANTIGKVLAEEEPGAAPKTVMLRSTVPPGTTETVVVPAIERSSARSHGDGFTVVFCPEFLREASALSDFHSPPFTIIGADSPEMIGLATELFSFIDAPTHVVATLTAECVKYASNSYHAVKVAFSNELSRVFTAVGADSREVMSLFMEDRELNISTRYLRPGFAYGGSCLPKDLRALDRLAAAHDVAVPLLSGVAASNIAHVQAAFHAITKLGVQQVAQFGITFKSSTDDLRESPYVALVRLLVVAGIDVRIFDPIIDPQRLTGANADYIRRAIPDFMQLLCESPEQALNGAEAIVLGNTGDTVCAVLQSTARDLPILDLRGDLPIDVEKELARRALPDGRPALTGLAW